MHDGNDLLLDDRQEQKTGIPDTIAAAKNIKPDKKEKAKSQALSQEMIDQRIESIRQLKAREKDLDLTSYRHLFTSRSQETVHLNEYLFLKNPNKYFSVNFENDIFADRDWYYTNGIRLDLINPGLSRTFLSKLMIPYKKPSSNYYGISLVHRMFTPKDPHVDSITFGDRPFSSYVYLGFFKVSNSVTKRYRQLSGFNLGMIGSIAMGREVMEIVHLPELTGWSNQINNDLVLDYHVRLEKGMIQGRLFEMGGMLNANAGTLYDKVGIGPYLIAGLYDPKKLECITEDTWSQTNPENEKAQCFLYYRFITTVVGYDATLQGGLFSNNSYALPPDQINRITFENRVGLMLSYRWVAFHAEYIWLSPEYQGCVPHRWMRYNLTFMF